MAKRSRGGKEWSKVDRNIRSRFPSHPLCKHSRREGPAGAVPTPTPFDAGLNIIRDVVSMSFRFTPWGWRSSKTAFWEQCVFKLQTRKKKKTEKKNKCWVCSVCGQCLWWLRRAGVQNCPGMIHIWIRAYGRVLVLQLMGWNSTYKDWGMTKRVLMLWVFVDNISSLTSSHCGPQINIMGWHGPSLSYPKWTTFCKVYYI